MHLLVGDGHYRGAPQEAERWNALVVRAEQRGCTEISILGDFFDLWIALPGMQTAWQDKLLAPIRRLNEDFESPRRATARRHGRVQGTSNSWPLVDSEKVG